MSASFDSKQFFEDAAKFFTDLQTSIDTQHSEQKKSQAKELDTLQRLLEERIASAHDVIQEQRTKIEKLSTTQTQQTQFIQELTRQIRELNERIEVLSTAAATIVPAPVIQPIQPNTPVQAPPVDAEKENAAPAGAIAKKAPKAKAPKSIDKDASVTKNPENEPSVPQIVTAITAEVAAVQAPEITAEQAPVVEPTVEAAQDSEPKTPLAVDDNAQVLDRFLKLNAVKEINDTLANLPKSSTLANNQLAAMNKLAVYECDVTCSADVFEFGLHSWLITLLMKGKYDNKGNTTQFLEEIISLFNKPNVTKPKKLPYPDNVEPAQISLNLGTMMSKNLINAYKKDPKKYIADHSDAIRSITKSIEAHCEGISGADSQVWIKFLNKWLNQTKE
jgi:hypothetical protein